MLPVFSRARQGWRILAASAVQVNHTGDTAETILATITVPGGAMGANGIIRLTVMMDGTDGADDKIVRVRLGGIGGTQYLAIAHTTAAAARDQVQIANRNAANSQVGFNAGNSGWGVGTSIASSAVNTAADTTIVITGQLENGANAISLESYLAELLYRP